MPERQSETHTVDPTRPWFDQVPWGSTPDVIADSAREYYDTTHPANRKLAEVLADIAVSGVLRLELQLHNVRRATILRLPPEIQEQIGFTPEEVTGDQQDLPNSSNADNS